MPLVRPWTSRSMCLTSVPLMLCILIYSAIVFGIMPTELGLMLIMLMALISLPVPLALVVLPIVKTSPVVSMSVLWCTFTGAVLSRLVMFPTRTPKCAGVVTPRMTLSRRRARLRIPFRLTRSLVKYPQSLGVTMVL